MTLRTQGFGAAAGIAIGLPGATGLSHLLDALLFGVSAWDPRTFVGVPAVLLLATFAACYIPAVRASRVDPIVALRSE